MLELLAVYIQNWDPVIFHLTETLALRWYGLAYVAGFVVGYFILKNLSRRNMWVVPEEKVSDVVTYTAFFGIFLGGRLGYVLFYMIPDHGLSYVLNDPLVIFRVWEGGMSAHGGAMGIFFFTLIYSRMNKISWTGLGDCIGVVAPVGILFGRFANFINGELYGRVTQGWWGIKFPKDLMENGQFSDAMAEAAQVNPGVQPLLDQYGYSGRALDGVLALARKDPALEQVIGNHVETRHASQLYEGLLEGLLLFLILYGVRIAFPKLRFGVLSGLYFLLYGIFRILVEQVREPDASIVFAETWAEMTKGQFYSVFMIIIGLSFITWAFTRPKRPVTA